MTFLGHQAPSAGFDAPFDMLEACHERVHRMVALLQRLQKHVELQGCDAQARQAAVDVMRYFDIAAPLHHQDEELHVFPLLMQQPDAVLHRTVQNLMDQHRSMERAWTVMRSVLEELSHGDSNQPFAALREEDVKMFAALYVQHIDLEELVAYPAARTKMTPQSLRAASEDMMCRRGVKPLAA